MSLAHYDCGLIPPDSLLVHWSQPGGATLHTAVLRQGGSETEVLTSRAKPTAHGSEAPVRPFNISDGFLSLTSEAAGNVGKGEGPLGNLEGEETNLLDLFFTASLARQLQLMASCWWRWAESN